MESPWNIQSIYELQYFNCPSCFFKDNSKQEFINHACEIHPESIEHLKNIQGKSLTDIVLPWGEVAVQIIKTEPICELETFQNNIKESIEDPLNIAHQDSIKSENNLGKKDITKMETKAKPNKKCKKAHKTIENDDRLEIDDFLNVEMVESEPPIIMESLKCLNCDYIAPNKQSLSHHKKNHRSCEKCGKKFSGGKSLRNYHNHVKKCGVLHKCPHCTKPFEQKSRLKKHLKFCKNDTDIVKCILCDKMFWDGNELKSHLICIHNK